MGRLRWSDTPLFQSKAHTRSYCHVSTPETLRLVANNPKLLQEGDDQRRGEVATRLSAHRSLPCRSLTDRQASHWLFRHTESLDTVFGRMPVPSEDAITTTHVWTALTLCEQWQLYKTI